MYLTVFPSAISRPYNIGMDRRIFLGALAGHHQVLAAIGKAGRVGQQARAHVDLEVGAAVAGAQGGGNLREAPARVERPAFPSEDCDGSIRVLVGNRRGALLVAEHFSLEAALLPGEVEGQAKGVRERLAVAVGARPVHEGRAFAAVDEVVMQLDALARDAALEQVQHAGHRVLAAAEKDDDLREGVQVDDRRGFGAAKEGDRLFGGHRGGR